MDFRDLPDAGRADSLAVDLVRNTLAKSPDSDFDLLRQCRIKTGRGFKGAIGVEDDSDSSMCSTTRFSS